MKILADAILAHWNTDTALPKLRFQYIPIEEFEAISGNHTLAAFRFEGFNREYGNGGAEFNTYNMAFTVIGLDAGVTWDIGQKAITNVNTLESNGLYNTSVEPSEMATPSELGGMNVWSFGFSARFSIFGA